MPNARANSAEAAGAFSWLNCVRPLLAVNRPTAIAKGIAASLAQAGCSAANPPVIIAAATSALLLTFPLPDLMHDTTNKHRRSIPSAVEAG